MDRQLPVWASFALVAAISALLLVSTRLVTQVFTPPEGVVGKDSAQGEALPAAERFVPVEITAGAGLDNCYEGQAGGQTLGYAAQVTVDGYAGPIELVVGMDLNGALTGISVGGAQFGETPGLGARAKEPEFKSQFVGIQAPVGLSADGASAAAPAGDATSSATQTGEWTATPEPAAAPARDATSGATQTGEWTATPEPAAPAGDATSAATQSGEWAATPEPAAQAGDATSAATQTGEWTAAPEPADGAAPEAAAASTVDGISGATITSRAVVGGVNLCAEFIKTLLAGGNA